MFLRFLFIGIFSLCTALSAQDGGFQKKQILGVSVEGTTNEVSKNIILQTSGLSSGVEVYIPGDEKFSEAIRKLYRIGSFSDIQIIVDKELGDGVFLLIRVKEEPLLGDYTLNGIRRSQTDDLKKEIPLTKGRPVRPQDIERAKQRIINFHARRGYVQTTVEATSTTRPDNRVDLTFNVNRGNRIEIGEVLITGNQQISTNTLKRKLKNTREDKWYRFWKKDTFNEEKYEEDLETIRSLYADRGFYDARITRDTVYTVANDGKAFTRVEININEGRRYFIRKIEWEGNTAYNDSQLSNALGIQTGDAYSAKILNENLYFSQKGNDISSLHMDQGYMTFRVTPTIRQVGADSLDFNFDIFEGDIFKVGNVIISGNTKTKEHVIRREIDTIPGNTFSRSDIKNSFTRLSQLSYFDQAKLYEGFSQEVNQNDKTVDLKYNLSEVSTDQLQFSGGWGGQGVGLILQLGLNFNNFSIQNLFNKKAWKPLPSGDGQKFSVNLQAGGKVYQTLSLAFQEPWFKGKPQPVGANLTFQHTDFNRYNSSITGTTSATQAPNNYTLLAGGLNYGTRLNFPDRFFQIGSSLGYKLYDINLANNREYGGLPSGKSRELSFRQTLSRNTQFPAIFPREGSQFSLGVSVAPPIKNFIQYHKWDLGFGWLLPLNKSISLSVDTEGGYVGSLNGKEVQFGLFEMGGSPLDAQGAINLGTELIYLRGYPYRAITQRNAYGDITGGRVFQKYSTELRFLATQGQQLSLEPYLFFDAANTWNSVTEYNPLKNYRATGVGARIFLPFLGLVEVNYGWALDPYRETNGSYIRPSKTGKFQFTMGAGF